MRGKIHSFANAAQFSRKVLLKPRKGDAPEQRLRLPPWISTALYRVPANSSCSSAPTVSSCEMEKPVFHPKKVVILSKVTRYEFEHTTNRGVKETQLAEILRKRGSDFSGLKHKHDQHHEFVDTIEQELNRIGIQTKVVQRMDYNEAMVKWADCIVSAGGDGTFLLAASRVHDSGKPVIGINTDPTGSEGYLCLMRKCSQDHIRTAFQRLLNGDFEWLYRQRIRITLTGDESTAAIPDAIELHDQQMNRKPSVSRWSDNPRELGEISPQYKPLPIRRKSVKMPQGERVTMDLPVLALNEVFIGESLSSRVSYYEIKVDNDKMVKQKSSGLTICTGTGSTSWYFNINKLTDQCVDEMMKIIQERCKVELPVNDKTVISDICTTFNRQLIFDPDRPHMAFCVRDPVFNATFLPSTPRGFAEKIRVKSRGYDAHLVIDGGVSYRFNDGAEALLEVKEEDALRTIIFR